MASSSRLTVKLYSPDGRGLTVESKIVIVQGELVGRAGFKSAFIRARNGITPAFARNSNNISLGIRAQIFGRDEGL